MSATEGVCFVAYGKTAEREYAGSVQTLPPGLPVALPPALDAAGVDCAWTDAQRARYAKVNLPGWSPFARTLYLDADARVFDRAAVAQGFAMLADGWEMALAPSRQQERDWLWHVGAEERRATLRECGGRLLQLQCGVLFFRRCEAVLRFFACWLDEWLRWQGEDQGAFLRALARCPVRLWLLGHPWNGGAVIGHRWGACRS